VFLLGELPQRQIDQIASHVGDCPACLRELSSLQEALGLLERLPLEQPSAGFEEKLQRALERREAGLARELPYWRGPALPRQRWRRPALAALPFVVFILLLGLAMKTGIFAPQRPTTVGQIVRVSGHPQMRMADEQRWTTAEVGSAVHGNVELATGETDRLEIELTDGSRITLEFGSLVKIGAIQRTEESTPSASLSVEQGTVWLLLTKSQREMVVSTPATRIRSLGTLFVVSVGRGISPRVEQQKGPRPEPTPRATVTVLRGRVQVFNQHGAVIAEEGTYTEATPDQPPRAPRGLKHLETVRLQAPWGQTHFEVWVVERLKLGEALKRIAGRRSWLGVDVTPTPMRLDGQPLVGPAPSVIRVVPGSPAEKAGITPGDRLSRVGRVTIESPEDLVKSELLLAPGQQVDLLIRRDGRDIEITVQLEERGVIPSQSEERMFADGNRLLALGRLAEARQQYNTLVARNKSNAAAQNNLGVIHQLDDETESAILAYREAVRLNPDIPLYRYNLAMSLLKIGNLTRAAEQLEAVLIVAPAFLDAGFHLGRIRTFLADYDGARRQAHLLQSSPATRAQGYCLMGEILRIEGDVDQSEAWYLMAAEEDPWHVDPPTYLGAVYFVQGKLDPAQAWTQRALELDPESLRALNRLGLILMRRDQLDSSEEVLLKAAAAHPDSGIVRNNLGLLYLKQGRLPAARAAYRDAVGLTPDGTLCHVGLAVALERSGQFDEAKREFAAALRLDPTYEEAYERLAALHRRLGETELAQNVRDQARQYGL